MRPASMALAAVTVCVLTSSISARAADEAAQSPLSGVYACADLTDDAARLACYDKEVAGLKAAETQGEMVAVDQQQIQTIKRQAFGFSLPSLPRLGLHLGGEGKTRPAKVSVSQDRFADAKTPEGAVLATNHKGEITKVGYAVKRIGSNGEGDYRFYLENGQIWEEVGSEHAHIPKPRKGEPNMAEIRKAALGSYLLVMNGRGKAIRVRRVQ